MQVLYWGCGSWSWADPEPGRGHSSPSTTEHSGNRPRHQLQIGAGQTASRVIRSPLEKTDFWKAWSSQGRELNGSQETKKKKKMAWDSKRPSSFNRACCEKCYPSTHVNQTVPMSLPSPHSLKQAHGDKVPLSSSLCLNISNWILQLGRCRDTTRTENKSGKQSLSAYSICTLFFSDVRKTLQRLSKCLKLLLSEPQAPPTIPPMISVCIKSHVQVIVNYIMWNFATQSSGQNSCWDSPGPAVFRVCTAMKHTHDHWIWYNYFSKWPLAHHCSERISPQSLPDVVWFLDLNETSKNVIYNNQDP